jgi:hypothetical protein
MAARFMPVKLPYALICIIYSHKHQLVVAVLLPQYWALTLAPCVYTWNEMKKIMVDQQLS